MYFLNAILLIGNWAKKQGEWGGGGLNKLNSVHLGSDWWEWESLVLAGLQVGEEEAWRLRLVYQKDGLPDLRHDAFGCERRWLMHPLAERKMLHRNEIVDTAFSGLYADKHHTL